MFWSKNEHVQRSVLQATLFSNQIWTSTGVSDCLSITVGWEHAIKVGRLDYFPSRVVPKTLTTVIAACPRVGAQKRFTGCSAQHHTAFTAKIHASSLVQASGDGKSRSFATPQKCRLQRQYDESEPESNNIKTFLFLCPRIKILKI